MQTKTPPLTQVEYNRQYMERAQIRTLTINFKGIDPRERRLYEFLCTCENKRKTIMNALEAYIDRADKV